jgi:hypothetical protein
MHCSSWDEVGQRELQRKINGIKHLAVLVHEVAGRKNRCKNKDLRAAVKVLGEVRSSWHQPIPANEFKRWAATARTLGHGRGCRDRIRLAALRRGAPNLEALSGQFVSDDELDEALGITPVR